MSASADMTPVMTSPWGRAAPSNVPCKSRYLDIHPEDCGVPACFLNNPHTFEPGAPQPGMNAFRSPWGIAAWGNIDMMDTSMRRMTTQSLYGKFGKSNIEEPPERQYCQILAERKLAKLRAGPPPVDTDMIVDMVLSNVRPRVWRRFRVSAATPLAALQDKVRPASTLLCLRNPGAGPYWHTLRNRLVCCDNAALQYQRGWFLHGALCDALPSCVTLCTRPAPPCV
jgi:hypothetical protein